MATGGEAEEEITITIDTGKISETEVDIFNCPICLELFKTPKCLPCQHTFCESCLQTYIQSAQSDGDSMESFQCPVCRQTVHSPDSNSQTSEWAHLMPTNKMIVSLMESSDFNKNRPKSDRNCGPCERDNEISHGVFWCLQCLESLCETCKRYHCRMRTFENHSLIHVDEMQENPTKITDTDEPCPEHENELLRVYCIGHKKMCCVICLTNDHRKCTLRTLDEMAEKITSDEGVNLFINQLQNITTRAFSVAQKKQENMESLKTEHKTISEQTLRLVNEAKSNLDKFHDDFQTKLNNLHKQQHIKLSETKQKIESFKKALEQGGKMLKAVAESGSAKQVFIAMEKLKTQLRGHVYQLDFCPEDNQEISLDHSIGNILTNLSDTTWTIKLADVKCRTDSCGQKILPEVETVKSMCQIQKPQRSAVLDADVENLKAVKIWDVKGDGWFTGGAFLLSGDLVCCDYRNSKLNVYNTNGRLSCSKDLDYCPYDVAVNTEDEIFVSGYSSNCLKTYVQRHNDLNEIHHIDLPSATITRGIVVQDNTIILACNKTITTLTVSGSVLKSIPSNDDARFVAASGKEALFCYYSKNSIVFQTLDGKELMKYPIPPLQKPRGIALDKTGNIYICGMDSHKIILISRDGRKTLSFMEKLASIKRPYAIGFDKKGTRLFVTSCRTDDECKDSLVAVYEMRMKTKM